MCAALRHVASQKILQRWTISRFNCITLKAPKRSPRTRGVPMPPITNRYTRLIGIDHPIVQEGLGPFRTPKLAAAVSSAGGLGTVSMPGMPEDIEAGART